MSENTFILRVDAPDAIGILADVMSLLARHNLNVVESHDFGDPDTQRFFVWACFEAPQAFNRSGFEAEFEALAQSRRISWSLRRQIDQPRTLVLVSKGDHCLNDLLYRNRRNRLGADIVAIASNHTVGKWHADRHDLPFFHIPVTADTKPEAEAELLHLVSRFSVELVVLARYMQVLSEELTQKLSGKCINIHHSALPSFKGAKPYHQAHRRGVKLIGATAHYVTSALDEGPIIAQDVEPVDHRLSADQLAERGRDIEARVLARAVSAHAEGRVFLNGHKTVVFA